MKHTLLCILLLLLLTGLLPLACLLPRARPSGAQTQSPESAESASQAAATLPADAPSDAGAPTPAPQAQGETILLWDSDSAALLEVPVLEYLVGAAASEMPADWPDQAILAQMVASHSYVLYLRDQGPGADLGGGWVAVAPARRQGYSTAEVLQSFWGEGFDQNYQRFSALAQQVQNALLTYQGAPAAACYHAISAGHTEASQNVWDQSLPYLQGVDSAPDKEAEGYAQSLEFSAQQLCDALSAGLGITPEGDPAEWFGATLWEDTGYVRSIQVAGQSVRGVDLRAALGLRSACFSVSYSGSSFFVLTHGYGHGVGLSQWGAKGMAEAGSSWQEILLHYFPGAEVSLG